MNLDGLSDRAQAALNGAEAYARDLKHRRMAPGHLLVALLTDRSGAVAALMGRLGADAESMQRRLHRELARLPRHAGEQPSWDPAVLTVVEDARRQSRRDGDRLVRTTHLLVAIADGPPGQARQVLQEAGVTRTAITYMLREVKDAVDAERAGVVPPASSTPAASSPSATDDGGRPDRKRARRDEGSMLEKFGRDLTQLAHDGKLDPIIGREREIRRLMQVLGRRTKNNPILVGEAGVGKTAIVEGFAHRIAGGDVPTNLRDKRLIELDIGAMVAGTTLRGQFEERVRRLVEEVNEAAGSVILYVDEVHSLVGAGGSGDGGGAADMLKPALARGQISMIGTTTPAEYRKHIESDKALERRFQEIAVEPPSIDDTIAILRGIKQKYEYHHRVQILDSAVQAAVTLAERYVMDRQLPDKAVDLIDEAASRLRMQVDSQPMEVFDLKRRIIQLEMEREAARESGRTSETARLDQELGTLKDELASIESRVAAEK